MIRVGIVGLGFMGRMHYRCWKAIPDATLTAIWAEETDLQWWGVDPSLSEPTTGPHGTELLPGTAHDLPFPDSHFDCVIFANVYEHVLPEHRTSSLAEIARVLAPGGVVVGQLPNPYFPIESHSRLPFMGWMPMRMQKVYWRLSPVDWSHDFFVVTIRDVERDARRAGLEVAYRTRFNYPPEVVPARVRWAAKPMRVIPWAWQFVLRKPLVNAPGRS